MTFIISPQWFSTHGVNDRDFAARTTPNQINQLFQQKDMPSELKRDMPNAYYNLKVRRKRILERRRK